MRPARFNKSSYLGCEPGLVRSLGLMGHGWDYNKNFDICHHIFIQIGVGILSRFEATGY
jgi:hypothetical protein